MLITYHDISLNSVLKLNKYILYDRINWQSESLLDNTGVIRNRCLRATINNSDAIISIWWFQKLVPVPPSSGQTNKTAGNLI